MNGHEEPRLTNMLAPTLLKPGNVVTIEPGIYLPGIGGVRVYPGGVTLYSSGSPP